MIKTVSQFMYTLSDLDKGEDSDAGMAEVMSGFIILICNSSVRMINERL